MNRKPILTMDTFGLYGRLGNNLFQYASLIGMEDHYNKELCLPEWEYSKYFEGDYPFSLMANKIDQNLIEPGYHFTPFLNEIPINTNITKSYLQSEKYWIHCKEDVLNALKFKKEFILDCLTPFTDVFLKETIAIHIRRGDYVNNENYFQLTPLYYINALEAHFPDWENMNLIFFSDDIEYTKIHFESLPNSFFSEGYTDIQDLCLGSLCTHNIIANSSFSWWQAYLNTNPNKKVIRPIHHFAGKLKERCNDKDLYPESWVPFDDLKKKICLRDTTFIIPFFFDHDDRQNNLNLNIAFLREYFYTNIVIEQFVQEKPTDMMHRTKMINDVVRRTDTRFIVNWDADVIVAPLQIYQTVKRLREGGDMVMPYDWRFARIPLRMGWHEKLECLDIGIVSGHRPSFIGFNPGDKESWGGAVFFNKESFIKGGMENENFISFGPEDSERRERFTRLGFKLERVKGPIYHLNHFKGINSGKKHCYFAHNAMEFKKVLAMDKTQLEEYVKGFSWLPS